ncbi:hypothetical protein HK102_008440, partial [Quaeritorhiza haematococci]
MASRTSANPLVPDLDGTITELNQSIAKIKDHLQLLLATPLDQQLARLANPLDRAKLEVMLAYTINSLFYGEQRVMPQSVSHSK